MDWRSSLFVPSTKPELEDMMMAQVRRIEQLESQKLALQQQIRNLVEEFNKILEDADLD